MRGSSRAQRATGERVSRPRRRTRTGLRHAWGRAGTAPARRALSERSGCRCGCGWGRGSDVPAPAGATASSVANATTAPSRRRAGAGDDERLAVAYRDVMDRNMRSPSYDRLRTEPTFASRERGDPLQRAKSESRSCKRSCASALRGEHRDRRSVGRGRRAPRSGLGRGATRRGRGASGVGFDLRSGSRGPRCDRGSVVDGARLRDLDRGFIAVPHPAVFAHPTLGSSP